MDIFGFDTVAFLSFVLTFMRVSLVLFLLPFFGGDSTPVQVKAAVCIVLTLAIWPNLAAIPGGAFPAHPWSIALVLLGEVVLGLSMGLMVQFVFAGVQLGGQIIGFQMGFSMLSIGDPLSGQQIIATASLANMVAMAIFLALNGHLHLLSALIGSFKLVPPGGLLLTPQSLTDMAGLSAQMFVLALKVAGPIVACLFMVELALALMARTAPQMNLLVLGFPIKIGVGFMFMGVMFSLIGLYLDEFVTGLAPAFNNFMRSVTP